MSSLKRVAHCQEAITPKGIRASSAWRNLASAAIADSPTCPDPFGLHAGLVRVAAEAHHCVPVRTYSALALCRSNVLPLCRECHERAELMASAGVVVALDPHALSSALEGEGWVKSLHLSPSATEQGVKKSAHDWDAVAYCKRFASGRVEKIWLASHTRARECIRMDCGVWCARMLKIKTGKCPVCA